VVVSPVLDPVTRRFARSASPHRPLMLMYHSVQGGSRTPEWPWAVSHKAFRDQLDFLQAEGYKTIVMSDLAAARVNPSRGTIIITFDDGYADNLLACDELHKRGMCASWFIVSGSIGQSPDWPADGRPAGRLLNEAELRLMLDAGMEIGSHTVRHLPLPQLDDTTQDRELTESKATLEDAIGAPVLSFAYPYGAWDERSEDAVRRARYTAACTTQTGWAMRDGNAYRLRRLTVFNHDSLGRFVRKLHFGSHDVGWGDMARYALRRTGLMR